MAIKLFTCLLFVKFDVNVLIRSLQRNRRV